jgi:HEAT repeat protein
LNEGASKAVATLIELLSQENEPQVRLNASKAILGALGGITELGELRQRIDDIENRSPMRITA